MTPKKWSKDGAAIKEFFGDHWVSERLDLELGKVVEISNKRSAAAQQKQCKSSAIAEQEHQHEQTHQHLHLQNCGLERGPRAHEASLAVEAEALGITFLNAAGYATFETAPPSWGDVHSRAFGWVRAGYPARMIAAETRNTITREGFKPINYLEQVFATAYAALQQPLPNSINARSRNGLG